MSYIIIIVIVILVLSWIISAIKSLFEWLSRAFSATMKFCKRDWYVPFGLLAIVLLSLVWGGAGFTIGLVVAIILYVACMLNRKQNDKMLSCVLENQFSRVGKTTYNQVVEKLGAYQNKNYVVSFEKIVSDFLSEIEMEHYNALRIDLWEDVIRYASSVLTGETTTIEIDKLIENANHDFSWTHISTEHKLVKNLFERNRDDSLCEYSIDVIPQKKGEKLVNIDAITKNDGVIYLNEEDLL